MARFVSFRGKMYPANESVSLIYAGKNKIAKEDLPDTVTIPENQKFLEPGQSFLYNGPDREALKMLHEQGVEYLGQDFMEDPEFMQISRNRGFNTVKEYLKAIGYDEAKDEAEFKKRASIVSMHELPQRVAEINVLGGGKDMSGNKADIIGGFGEERLRPAKELATTKKE